MIKTFHLAIFIIFFQLFPFIPKGQESLNLFLKELSNEKAVYEIAKVGVAAILDSQKVRVPKMQIFVTSINVDSLISVFGKENLEKSLLPLFMDERRDWYVNLLLYHITKTDASSFMVITNKYEWLKYDYKKRDYNYWKQLIVEKNEHPVF